MYMYESGSINRLRTLCVQFNIKKEVYKHFLHFVGLAARTGLKQCAALSFATQHVMSQKLGGGRMDCQHQLLSAYLLYEGDTREAMYSFVYIIC